MDKISLSDFYDLLEKHDWYFAYSDDSRVYDKGHREASLIEKLSKQSPEHEKLLEAFVRHYFSGKPWDSEQAPKPPRPDLH